MQFLNGESSPFFEIENTNGDWEDSAEIDTSREIRAISMRLRGGLMYAGITFYDDEGAVINNSTWSRNEKFSETPI